MAPAIVGWEGVPPPPPHSTGGKSNILRIGSSFASGLALNSISNSGDPFALLTRVNLAAKSQHSRLVHRARCQHFFHSLINSSGGGLPAAGLEDLGEVPIVGGPIWLLNDPLAPPPPN